MGTGRENGLYSRLRLEYRKRLPRMLRDLIGSEPSARFNPFPLTTATTIDQFGRFIDQIGQFAELDGRLVALADTLPVARRSASTIPGIVRASLG